MRCRLPNHKIINMIKIYFLNNWLKVLAYLTTSFYIHDVLGQDNVHYFESSSAVQVGYGLKTTFDISRVEKFSFRIALSGGVGAFIGRNWFYPTLNGDFTIYKGGLGSNRPGRKTGKWFDLESVISYTATLGVTKRLNQNDKFGPSHRNYPLYYFSNRNLPSLQNPYRWSFSIGGNTVIFFSRRKDKVQHVGFLNIHLDRFQGNYANDGPPFSPPLGDRYDRFNTGIGFITFHGNNNWAVNLVEIGYNKFTGYSPSSYEISNKLGSSYVFYKETNENYYNKSNFQINVGNTVKNWGVSAIAYNHPKLDIQHRIHNNKYYPLHLVPYERTIALGPIFYFQQSKIGQQ